MLYSINFHLIFYDFIIFHKLFWLSTELFFLILLNYYFLIIRRRKVRSVIVVVAEWLRRQTRNLLGYARVGSNPADYVCKLLAPKSFMLGYQKVKISRYWIKGKDSDLNTKFSYFLRDRKAMEIFNASLFPCNRMRHFSASFNCTGYYQVRDDAWKRDHKTLFQCSITKTRMRRTLLTLPSPSFIFTLGKARRLHPSRVDVSEWKGLSKNKKKLVNIVK